MRTVGIGVIIKSNKILVGLRGPECTIGAGHWGLPGGKLEDDESIINCAMREVMEECGLTIDIITSPSESPIFAVTDHHPISHITLWIKAWWMSGEPTIKEPTKCLQWSWKTLFEIAEIPGVHDPKNEAYHWLPIPLFKRHIYPIVVCY